MLMDYYLSTKCVVYARQRNWCRKGRASKKCALSICIKHEIIFNQWTTDYYTLYIWMYDQHLLLLCYFIQYLFKINRTTVSIEITTTLSIHRYLFLALFSFHLLSVFLFFFSLYFFCFLYFSGKKIVCKLLNCFIFLHCAKRIYRPKRIVSDDGKNWII